MSYCHARLRPGHVRHAGPEVLPPPLISSISATFRPFKSIKCSKDANRRSEARASETASTSRRDVLFAGAAVTTMLNSMPAGALGFKKELKKRRRSEDEYSEGQSGLKELDLETGAGAAVKEGDIVTVHFDSIFKGIDVASSRSARLLGGNRTISEPFTFTAGKAISTVQKQAGETAGGLFSGQSGPKPPPALSAAVLGMKPGGKRSVLVPPQQAYGAEGYLEIPPGSAIELRVELLSIGSS